MRRGNDHERLRSEHRDELMVVSELDQAGMKWQCSDA